MNQTLINNLNAKQLRAVNRLNAEIEAKNMAKSVLVKVKGKDGLTYTVDPTVTFKGRNKFAQMDLVQLGD
jgi:hypothetical protein